MDQTRSDVFWLASPVTEQEKILWSRQGKAGRLLVTCFPETSMELPMSLSAGERLTLNFLKSHNAGKESSSLRASMETSTQPEYSLSSTAKTGILRRAAARHKELPAADRARPDERRVGKGGFSTCRSGGA